MTVTSDSAAHERWIAIAQVDSPAGSGDCVRVMSQRDGRALVFVGDVAGHDARAARLARQLDARVFGFAGCVGPGGLLTILNESVEADWPADVFVSAICFSLDAGTGIGSIAAAGQLPPIAKSIASSAPIEVRGGPPLGVVADTIYVERAFKLAAGDVLVAVTDGVTDPLATGHDPLGLSALARIVDRAPPHPSDVCAALMRAARQAGLRDDATAVAVAPGLRTGAMSAFTFRDRPCLAV